ncbi:alpha-amylase [archaeon D22]|nr:alpha-amylase [archaeon D22]
MVDICFYFQVHQPFRLKQFSVFDVGQKKDYFDEEKNREIMKKVAMKCYIPTNLLMLELLKNHPEFKISYSISGVALEQFELYAPEVLESFKELVKTGRVEILSETYYHSLAYIYSKEEFLAQVKQHREKVEKIFGVTPTVFRNTELIYNNEIAKFVEDMGYEAIICEGLDHALGWRSPNFVYKPHTTEKIKLLMKNYRLSDDIAFRFSNKGWAEWPLTTKKFCNWADAVNGSGEIINLFMDYETFGEHQWEDTGIFEFLRELPNEFLKNPDNGFVTPSEAARKFKVHDVVDIHNLSSWADIERDLTAWLGNKMQQSSIKELYMIEDLVKKSDDKKILDDFRKLTTSDHFYYMCTKWFSDGDVHKYFSPYESPYDSFIAFMNVLNDMIIRLKEKNLTIHVDNS